jgi:hypothetical protein
LFFYIHGFISDSIVYRYRTQLGDPIGNSSQLGDMTSEVPPGEEIDEFISGIASSFC